MPGFVACRPAPLICRFGVDIARTFLGQKLSGQALLVASLFDDHDTGGEIVGLARETHGAATVDELRGIAPTGAALYWRACTGRPECVALCQGPTPSTSALASVRRPALCARLSQREQEG
jgi:hypothetical protein